VLNDNAIAGLPSSAVNVTATVRLAPTTTATLPEIEGVTLTEVLVPADPSELVHPARLVRNAMYAHNARTDKHCMVFLPQGDGKRWMIMREQVRLPHGVHSFGCGIT
jgi:hypothetical protein